MSTTHHAMHVEPLVDDRPRLAILEADGSLPVAYMRDLFERCIRETPKLSKTDLEHRESASGFDGYADHDVNMLWAGWALGMRASDRIITAEIEAEKARRAEP